MCPVQDHVAGGGGGHRGQRRKTQYLFVVVELVHHLAPRRSAAAAVARHGGNVARLPGLTDAVGGGVGRDDRGRGGGRHRNGIDEVPSTNHLGTGGVARERGGVVHHGDLDARCRNEPGPRGHTPCRPHDWALGPALVVAARRLEQLTAQQPMMAAVEQGGGLVLAIRYL